MKYSEATIITMLAIWSEWSMLYRILYAIGGLIILMGGTMFILILTSDKDKRKQLYSKIKTKFRRNV